jgi:methylmalonyl-CoA/ethylmalonyl-CoA epimerase
VLELGGTHIEFLSSRDPDSKVGRLLRERGEGMHHLSFQVENITTEMARCRAAGVRLLDAAPRAGLHGRRIAFLNPEDTAGVLIELVEESGGSKEVSQ